MRYGIYDKNDHTQLKQLWKKAFYDTDAYIEYYFSNVANRNMIFVAWDEEKLVSMVHLNPYTLVCQGTELLCHYIVGVATEPEYRNRGIMKQLLHTALSELQDRGEGFTYLMPAKEEYYYGLGFQRMEPGYIFSWKDYVSIYEKDQEEHNQHDHEGQRYDISSMSNWRLLNLDDITDLQWEDFNRKLSERYDLFARRDAFYMTDLKQQCQSMSGDVYIVSNQEKIIATMGIMYDEDRPECVQYITTEDSLLPLLYVEKQLSNGGFTEIEIFGKWFEERYPQLETKQGKGIMYKIFVKYLSNVISCDKMLLINEIV